MTPKQIEKSIESATKKIAKHRKSADMFRTRAINAIAKLNKRYGIEMTLDNITITEERGAYGYEVNVTINEPFNGIIEWSDAYTATNNIRSMAENEHRIKQEERIIEHLRAELDAALATAKSNADAIAPVETALRNAMADFRIQWFDRMIEWHNRHFDRMKAEEPAVRAKRSEAYDAQRAAKWGSIEYKNADALIHKCNRFLSDPAIIAENREEYIARIERDLESVWERGITTLADKCRKFGINESAIKCYEPVVSERGFEVIITDDRNRVIDARVIWAAEYSDIVTPHTRYIVTERHNK